MKKTLFCTWLGVLMCVYADAQSVGIGTMTPDTSAQLDISTTSKGLLIPRMHTTAIQEIPNPAKGLLVLDTTRNELFVNMGTHGSPNWKSIATNSSWSVAGNEGMDPATHFIGTTDNASLYFRIRDTPSGKIDSLSAQTFFGYKAGMNSTTNAVYNTAFGNNSLSSNTTGHTNTAVGAYALNANTTGIQNSAFGKNALKNNTVSHFSVAFGYRALENNAANSNSAFGNSTLASNTTGYANTALGSNAMGFNSTGSFNVAVGRTAMFGNTSGSNNVGVGLDALSSNTTGFYNAALGDAAIKANTVGTGNTACGSGALFSTTQSSYNTALGYHAGFAHSLGWNNTLIGADCNFTGSDMFNSVALGHNVIITANSQARIGNSATTSIGGYASWTNISDGRYKKNIREDVRGLSFIMKLRPVTYQLDVTGLSARYSEFTVHRDAPGMNKAIREKENVIQTGFIAQEVEKAAEASGYDFSGVDRPKNQEDLYGLRYAEFVVPLVKAVQELNQQVQDLQHQLDMIKKQMDE